MTHDDPIITADDVLKAGHCVVPGLRDWCESHDLDFRKFVREGYRASVLLERGDALAERVIELRKQRDGR